VIRQSREQAFEPCMIDISDHTRDLGRIGCVKEAQSNDRGSMKAARREIDVTRLNQLIPVGTKVRELSADPANEMGLIRPWQRCQK
jgi:hypothetical protein